MKSNTKLSIVEDTILDIKYIREDDTSTVVGIISDGNLCKPETVLLRRIYGGTLSTANRIKQREIIKRFDKYYGRYIHDLPFLQETKFVISTSSVPGTTDCFVTNMFEEIHSDITKPPRNHLLFKMKYSGDMELLGMVSNNLVYPPNVDNIKRAKSYGMTYNKFDQKLSGWNVRHPFVEWIKRRDNLNNIYDAMEKNKINFKAIDRSGDKDKVRQDILNLYWELTELNTQLACMYREEYINIK